MALGWLRWRAWTGLVAGDAAALCVAGVALGDMPSFRVAGKALGDIHLVLRGRRGTYGLGWQLSACGAVFCKHVKKNNFPREACVRFTARSLTPCSGGGYERKSHT